MAVINNSKSTKATLALADGTVFEGYSVGVEGETGGEVVFNTSMSGYQEILTDPSYAFQMLTFTYPHIGNVGVNKEDVESDKVHVAGFISREFCEHPSNYRAEKIKRIASEIPKTQIDGKETGELLVLGWGSTEGSITEAVNKARAEGIEVSRAHVHYMNPLPPDLESIIKSFKRVLVPEINCGQLTKVIKSESGNGEQLNLIGFNQVMGLPLNVKNLVKEIIALARPQ